MLQAVSFQRRSTVDLGSFMTRCACMAMPVLVPFYDVYGEDSDPAPKPRLLGIKD